MRRSRLIPLLALGASIGVAADTGPKSATINSKPGFGTNAVNPVTGLPVITPASSKFRPVSVATKQGGWQLSELYEVAAQWLKDKEHVSDETRTNATVMVYTQAEDVMCCFTFTHPKLFNRPAWFVAIGFDGKVKSCQQYTAREGEASAVKMPVPPPEKPPSKER